MERTSQSSSSTRTSDTASTAKVLEGLYKLSSAVRVTLGPCGQKVSIDEGPGVSRQTKDGITVGRSIEFEDSDENLGASLARAAARRTGDVVGDGTTTATIIAEAIFREGLKEIVSGVEPLALHRGIQRAAEAVDQSIVKLARPVSSKRDLSQIAKIAASNDQELGDFLADALWKVGKDGIVTVEEGRGLGTSLELNEGMQFDRGFLSPYFVTDRDENTVELENPYILMFDDKISSINKLVPLLEEIQKANRPLVIIADAVEGEALASLVINKLRGILQACAVTAPGEGEERKAMMDYIGALTAGRPISKDLGIDLDKVTLADLGVAKKVKITAHDTIIVAGAGTQDDLRRRIDAMRNEIAATGSESAREKLQKRFAQLTGGVAQINCGAATEQEMKYRKAITEDALAATRAAFQEGFVPGGGVVLMRAAQALKALNLPEDEQVGVDVMRRALDEPLRAISENANLDADAVLDRVRSMGDYEGVNVLTNEFGNMESFGVIDPAKVVRTAVSEGVGAASLLLTHKDLMTDDLPLADLGLAESATSRAPGHRGFRAHGDTNRGRTKATRRGIKRPIAEIEELAEADAALTVQHDYTLCLSMSDEAKPSLVATGQGEIPVDSIPEQGIDSEWTIRSRTVKFRQVDADVAVTEQDLAGPLWSASFPLHIPRHGDSETRRIGVSPQNATADLEVLIFIQRFKGDYVRNELYRTFTIRLPVDS